MRFFPEPDSPALAPFTQAFLRVMFAHVSFEHRVADLAEVITLELGFGETTALFWSAKERPKKFRKLCTQYQRKHVGGLPEADAIAEYFDEAFLLCGDRNWLAHGLWWRFDANTGVIDVHAVRVRPGELLNREFTVEQIERIATAFADVEVELWKLQKAIEDRLPPEPLPPELSDAV
jgi:hypothetical protein